MDDPTPIQNEPNDDAPRALALLRKMLGVSTTSTRTAQISFDGYGVNLETETHLDDSEYELVTRLLREGFKGHLAGGVR